MIITLTPNTGIDHTIQISSFQLNSTLRATASAWGMGGKAIDVSWTLGTIGVPTRALGFAAGETGRRMDSMLRERGAETDFVWVQGESRLNTVIVVEGEGQSTITSSSLRVLPEHVLELMTGYERALDGASCVVMGGSLPQGVSTDFYRAAISIAKERGIPVIFDSSGPALVDGVKAHPDVIKPNLTEVEDLLGYRPNSREQVLRAARTLWEEHGCHVIVTMGSEGAVAVCDDQSYFVHPISVPVTSAAGAGDGVLAGMALGYLRRESFEAGLRHGFALAGAILQTLPTADLRSADYQALLPQISIEPLL